MKNFIKILLKLHKLCYILKANNSVHFFYQTSTT